MKIPHTISVSLMTKVKQQIQLSILPPLKIKTWVWSGKRQGGFLAGSRGKNPMDESRGFK